MQQIPMDSVAAQTNLSAEDLGRIEEYGLIAGGHFAEATNTLQSFIDFMAKKQLAIEDFNIVAAAFKKGIQCACKVKGLTQKHGQNLVRVVFEVLKNPGWLLLKTNYWINASRNRARLNLQQAALADARLLKTQEQLAEVLEEVGPPAETQSNVLWVCTLCRQEGCLVICEAPSCLNRYHWTCAGLKPNQYKKKKYFCDQCQKGNGTAAATKRKVLRAAQTKKKPRSRLDADPSKDVANDDDDSDDDDDAETDDNGDDHSTNEDDDNDDDDDDGRGHDGDDNDDDDDDGHDLVTGRNPSPSSSAGTALAAQPAANISESDDDGDDGDDDDDDDDNDTIDSDNTASRCGRDVGDTSSDESSPPEPGPTDPRFYFDMFNVPNIVEDAIETLIALDSGLPPHAALFLDISTKLTKLASFLASMYGNDSYKTLVSGTLEELEQYLGQEKTKLPHSKVFLKELLRYGFCITPRMWKKEEIVCICISLLDPRLNFTGIRQKDGVNSQHSFRGMAGLDSKVQQIFYRRLRAYGFVNPRWHPEKLQSFSSVVINGGGSWKQSSDWTFNHQFRFVVDTSVKPFMIHVCPTGSGALEAGGVYVASTTRKNGQPVYVQVSKREYSGFVGQNSFRDCIKEECRASVKQFLLGSQGSRVDACSPRVLVCCEEGTDDWGIQLLPGFGSDLYIFKFGWNGKTVSNASRFTNIDFETFTAEMKPCSLSISTLHHESCLKSGESDRHVFSFGTLKSVIPAVDKMKMKRGYMPEPLIPQGFHSDGPTVGNAQTFDMRGQVRPGAPACHERKKGCWFPLIFNALSPYLGDHISIMQESFSALFGMFKGTFIETPISDDGPRGTAALTVDVPLGTAIVFTFAWEHRGKGDSPGFVPNSHSPVEVHARPHFYVYGKDFRKLPTIDLEATLEFASICSQKHNSRASQIQVLDCLQTFDPYTAMGHWNAPKVHERFKTQTDLETYIASQLRQQRSHKINAGSDHESCQNCQNWFLSLTQNDSEFRLRLHWDYLPGGVVVTSACLDSDQPSFRDSNGILYMLSGNPKEQATFPANTLDSTSFRADFDKHVLLSANKAAADLCKQWSESNLLHLCCILNTRAMTQCTLSIDSQGWRAKGCIGGCTKNLGSVVKDDTCDRILVDASGYILIIGDIVVNDKRKPCKPQDFTAAPEPDKAPSSSGVSHDPTVRRSIRKQGPQTHRRSIGKPAPRP